ncbi:hypothetical protein [Aeromonas phage 4L372D]|uniref:Uncharacterized protein n=2 Tax=Plateaulakevirus TaxID=2843436 RepID=A0A5B9N3R2_9CAUD|nr:hypothetical protein HWC25_gp046 [Aeromonas phage 2L372D]YP_009846618.1 hypothetical protein HWC27_gp070 [Aeromonas phage 4L372D]QDB73960.1 hypothetical protein 2L372D_046 [Aeromonas phage 2L372D]QEG08534.1 hypothetical protein [Aeromonas phage 4L372D]
MSFYVWDTPEVAKHFNVSYSSKHHFYVSIDNTVYKDDSRTYMGKSSIEEMMLLGIPEYKLHPAHGLIPANSKLFKEDTNKEHKEKQMKQPVKKVFEVGDKCVIRNPNNYELMEEVKKYFIDKECKIVAKFKLSIPMVVVQFVDPENSDMLGVCVVFREEMCYPVKTHKEKTIDKMKEVCDYKGSWSSLYQQFASDLYDAGFRFEGDVE